MQNTTPTPAKRPRRRNRTILPVAAASLVAFVGVFGLLGAQMAEGQDPLLGSGKPQTAQVKPVTTRKVIIKQEAPATASSAGTAAAPASSGSTYSAPVQQSAPVQSAPVQSAPAPVQSGSS